MCELGQFLPAQARYPARAAVVGQADAVRVQDGAAGAQEFAQFIAAGEAKATVVVLCAPCALFRLQAP